ncbi:MAG: ribosome silencing factor [Planctomycetes bacterium]|nr:ribosome silencing factor [Planctomycetota bacterium]
MVKKKTSKIAKKKTQKKASAAKPKTQKKVSVATPKTKKKVSAAKPKTQQKKALDQARAFALAAAKAAAESHCSEIVVLDLSGKSPATDFFVIATGTSDRQMRTVADEINEAAREHNFQRFGRAGYEQARWILLDYVDVVIHIFDSEYRDYYDLELLWGDAERLTIEKKIATEGTEI